MGRGSREVGTSHPTENAHVCCSHRVVGISGKKSSKIHVCGKDVGRRGIPDAGPTVKIDPTWYHKHQVPTDDVGKKFPQWYHVTLHELTWVFPRGSISTAGPTLWELVIPQVVPPRENSHRWEEVGIFPYGIPTWEN